MATLYVASDRPRAGRTALCVTLAQRLRQDGRQVAAFKPFHSPANGGDADPDASILAAAAGATPPGDAWPIPVSQDAEPDVARAMRAYGEATAGADVAIVEGLSGFDGASGEASGRMAREMDAIVVAVIAYRDGIGLEEARAARQLFGERLAGVVINGVTRYKSREVSEQLAPLFQAQNVRVLASIPEDRRLLGVTAGQIADHLGGTFLDWEEKRDNFVEHYLIGGMVLDWGVLYFQQFDNKAVIVRGNRPDLQMAALRTPTSCIVLTGGYPPIQYVSYEAGEEEVPLIQVETDTLETAAALESLQERAQFDHPLKHEQFRELMSRHADWDALLGALAG